MASVSQPKFVDKQLSSENKRNNSKMKSVKVFLHFFHSSKECILRYRGSCNFAFIVLYFYISLLFFAPDV